MQSMTIGIKGTLSKTVEKEDTAKSVGSGTLDVLATPTVIALAEECAWTSIQSYLSEGQTTVGISLQIKHIAPTPLGMNIICRTDLVKTEGRKLSFTFEVFDEIEKIAFGTHDRFIVESDKFNDKTTSKQTFHAKDR